MIQSKARRSASKDVKKFDSENNEQVYLPIWLIMNELTTAVGVILVACNQSIIMRRIPHMSGGNPLASQAPVAHAVPHMSGGASSSSWNTQAKDLLSPHKWG